jgi:hypothetical protein
MNSPRITSVRLQLPYTLDDGFEYSAFWHLEVEYVPLTRSVIRAWVYYQLAGIASTPQAPIWEALSKETQEEIRVEAEAEYRRDYEPGFVAKQAREAEQFEKGKELCHR